MRKLLLVLLLAAALPALPAAAPQQSPEAEKAVQATERPAEGEHSGLIVWKWANFAVLAIALGWVVKKNAGPFFAARSLRIRKDMLEADDLRKQAEERAAEVERRLANLGNDIAALREESSREAGAETERLSHWAAAEIAKLQANAEQEIDSAGKAARTELKRYVAELAIGLAEKKIRARLTPEAQDSLVAGFMRKLEAPAQPRPSN